MSSLIFDAHLDLAMNAIEWNRDLTRPLAEVRQREAHLKDKPDRGRGTVTFSEMRRGRVGLCVATQSCTCALHFAACQRAIGRTLGWFSEWE